MYALLRKGTLYRARVRQFYLLLVFYLNEGSYTWVQLPHEFVNLHYHAPTLDVTNKDSVPLNLHMPPLGYDLPNHLH